MNPIYLDNHSTTQTDPRVLEAMLPYFTDKYGNPASRTHRYGWESEEAIESAREQLASLINADSNQIIFTSGATESNNMVINHFNDGQYLSSSIEHSSIKSVLPDWLVDEIYTNKDGQADLDHMLELLHETSYDFDIAFVMAVNNEIGTIQPVKTVRGLIGHTKIHSDMAQALGKINIDVQDLDVDFASFSAHKIYGPKGVGALYIKKPEGFKSLIQGGNHEFGLRAGTPNVPAIVGFGKACEIIQKESIFQATSKIQSLNAALKSKLRELVPDIIIHEFPKAVPNTVHVAVPCKDMDTFMSSLEPNVSVSFGSACMSLHDATSYVLKAVGIPDEEIFRSIRMGIGKFNTQEEMELAAYHIARAVKKARG